MIEHSWLWVVFTLVAALGQTARNAMQRELTAVLGTAGATQSTAVVTAIAQELSGFIWAVSRAVAASVS